MKLNHNLHLAYCTNIHRGETWAETFAALKNYTLAVRQRVCPDQPYAIGLRLSNRAAQELGDAETLLAFQRWLAANQCYVFTINGFPYGQFHGTRVKTGVYVPDWTTPERLAYTNRLFDLLAQLLPDHVEGSVSTLPCGFKGLVTTPEEHALIRANLWRCVEHVARVSEQTGRKLHLGLEPEPMCVLEGSAEVLHFFDRLRVEHPNDPRLNEHLGVNYDTCHYAVEFENPQEAIGCLQQHGIKLSKIHLSNALRVKPTAEARTALSAFADDVYLHQVVVQQADGQRSIYRDLRDALTGEAAATAALEWRIHFHIPLHSPPTALFGNTADHLLGVLDLLAGDPALCSHLEMETYTWEVLPPEMKNRDVVEQLVAEYEWTLRSLVERGLANAA
ncbi:MAG: metabolite traffic protein EboE [Verrucomicrobiae bacterium]|nr:metabolite traffic protein EboE [Verrucomicrobiae bacterium]